MIPSQGTKIPQATWHAPPPQRTFRARGNMSSFVTELGERELGATGSHLLYCTVGRCVGKNEGNRGGSREKQMWGEEEGRTGSKRGRDSTDDPAWIPDFCHSNSVPG